MPDLELDTIVSNAPAVVDGGNPAVLRVTALGKVRGQGSMRVVGGHALHSRETLSSRTAVAEAAALAVNAAGWRMADGPVALFVRAHLARPRSHYRTGKRAGEVKPDAPELPLRTPDLDKIVRLVGDALTAAGVWTDDARVTRHDAGKLYAGWLEPERLELLVIDLRRMSELLAQTLVATA